jgi:hypothetical protein
LALPLTILRLKWDQTQLFPVDNGCDELDGVGVAARRTSDFELVGFGGWDATISISCCFEGILLGFRRLR